MQHSHTYIHILRTSHVTALHIIIPYKHNTTCTQTHTQTHTHTHTHTDTQTHTRTHTCQKIHYLHHPPAEKILSQQQFPIEGSISTTWTHVYLIYVPEHMYVHTRTVIHIN